MTPEPSIIPKRLAVKRALVEHLQGITKAEGYNFDIGVDRVLMNRSLLGDHAFVQPGPPLLSVIEAPRPDFTLYAGDWSDRRRETLTILIQGIVVDDKQATTADDADFLAFDVERRLARCLALDERGRPMFPDEHMFGDKITGMEIAAPVVRPPEAGVSAFHFFFLPVRMSLAGKIGQ